MKNIMYNFKEIKDYRGSLVVIQEINDIPFEIKRIYYMYSVKQDVIRGLHAHKTLQQVLICISGSCKILLDDGIEKEILMLDKKNYGLYIGAHIWREIFDFSEDAVLLVLASDFYDEKDYIRNYEDFIKYISSTNDIA
jgi:dTDP-4-dehydrorhamnose 3,5-epimerase-like enzyme